MPARTRRDPALTVTFMRGGEVLDTRSAPTGERAVKVAILMLVKMEQLQGGDQLVVIEAPDLPDIPEASRSGHYSG